MQYAQVAVIGLSAAWAADQLMENGVAGKKLKRKKNRKIAAPTIGAGVGLYARKLMIQGNP
jgi:hypothetical protein